MLPYYFVGVYKLEQYTGGDKQKSSSLKFWLTKEGIVHVAVHEAVISSPDPTPKGGKGQVHIERFLGGLFLNSDMPTRFTLPEGYFFKFI